MTPAPVRCPACSSENPGSALHCERCACGLELLLTPDRAAREAYGERLRLARRLWQERAALEAKVTALTGLVAERDAELARLTPALVRAQDDLRRLERERAGAQQETEAAAANACASAERLTVLAREKADLEGRSDRAEQSARMLEGRLMAAEDEVAHLRDQVEALTSARASAPAPTSAWLACPHCQARASISARFCAACGGVLTVELKPTPGGRTIYVMFEWREAGVKIWASASDGRPLPDIRIHHHQYKNNSTSTRLMWSMEPTWGTIVSGVQTRDTVWVDTDIPVIWLARAARSGGSIQLPRPAIQLWVADLRPAVVGGEPIR